MPVKLIGKAVDVLMNLLYAAVEDRKAKLENHGLKYDKKAKALRRDYELARKDLEIQQANKAVDLYKALKDAEEALSGIKK